MSKNYIDYGTEQNSRRRHQLFTCGVNSSYSERSLSQNDCMGRLGVWLPSVERSVGFCGNYCEGDSM